MDDNLDNDFNAKNWILKANKPPELENLAVMISTSELLVMHKYDPFCQLVPATKASYSKSVFNKNYD